MEELTTSQDKAKKIIDDLIALDPELKEMEDKLKKIILEFIKNKPEIIINQNFEQELREVINNEIMKLQADNKKETPAWSQQVFFKKLAFSLGAILIAAAIIYPALNYFQKTPLSNKQLVKNDRGNITRLSSEAFGNIGAISPAQERVLEYSDAVAAISTGDEVVSSQALGLGGFNVSSSPLEPTVMPPFEYPSFNYIYEGDDLEDIIANMSQVDVYKRITTNYNNKNILSSIFATNSSLINLNKFNNSQSQLTNFSITEDKEFGYMLNFDANTGSISIYQNWNKWPQTNRMCYEENCILDNQLKYQDLISNEEAILIAEKFLQDYGVSMNDYSEPVINYDFHKLYQESDVRMSLYLPEETTVVFPFLIEGQEVYDEAGSAYGLYVSVSSRYKKVTSLNNLMPNQYEVSAYPAFTDVNKILEIAEAGGLNSYQDPYASKVIDVKLGSPSIILIRQFQMNQGYGPGSEIFVPALSFPVDSLSEETEYFYKKNVIIPLVEEMINNDNYFEIMPYMMR